MHFINLDCVKADGTIVTDQTTGLTASCLKYSCDKGVYTGN